jgi:hypothetical protein
MVSYRFPGLKADIEAALGEYHNVSKQVVEANAELARLGAQIGDLGERARIQEQYVISLGEFGLLLLFVVVCSLTFVERTV